MVQLFGVEVRDGRVDNPNVLAVHLTGILQAVDVLAVRWIWSLHYFWGVGVLPSPKSVLDYEKDAMSSATEGIVISRKELEILAACTEQIIDAVIVASDDPDVVRKYECDADLYTSNELVIEANDSSYWRVVSKHQKLVDAVVARFHDVRVLTFSPDGTPSHERRP